MSALLLVSWTAAAFLVLGLAGYAIANVLKQAIRPAWTRVFGMADGSTSRSMYRGAIRSIPTFVCGIVGGAHWALVLLQSPAADHFAMWPEGLAPLAEPVLAVAAGGMSMVIHESVTSLLPRFLAAMGTAAATRAGGERIEVESADASDESTDTLEFAPEPAPAPRTLEP